MGRRMRMKRGRVLSPWGELHFFVVARMRSNKKRRKRQGKGLRRKRRMRETRRRRKNKKWLYGRRGKWMRKKGKTRAGRVVCHFSLDEGDGGGKEQKEGKGERRQRGTK